MNEWILFILGFRYTYLTREKVDALDVGCLNVQRLATALQREVYRDNKREMHKNVDDRVDQGAIKWIYEVSDTIINGKSYLFYCSACYTDVSTPHKIRRIWQWGQWEIVSISMQLTQELREMLLLFHSRKFKRRGRGKDPMIRIRRERTHLSIDRQEYWVNPPDPHPLIEKSHLILLRQNERE